MKKNSPAELTPEMLHKADITLTEEISWVVGDLWNTEKHLSQVISRVEKDKKTKYMLFLNEIRNLRKYYENLFIKHNNLDFKSAEWCIYKHMCGIMVQSVEVGSKLSFLEKFGDASKCYEISDEMRNLILMLIKIIKGENVGKKEYKGTT
ncbi:MAG: hypothetical protein ACTSWZ_07710 [Candidatus Heimdallarchaeaceae archaeon]